jgi:hypothetical protein
MYRGGWTLEYELRSGKMINPRYSIWASNDAFYRILENSLKELFV